MIDGLRPYAEMTPSGLPWLGFIPEGWQARRAKYSFQEVDDRSEQGDEELLSVSHKTGVTPRSQKNVTMFMAESYEGHKVCRPSDIVVNTMWAWMAAIGVSRHHGLISPAYAVYRPRSSDRFEPRYLDYLLRTETYRAEYVRKSRGITTSRLRLYPPDFLSIPLLQPSLEEQQLIVRFLDWHGAQTAKLIRAKRKIIALLNEQKQAIIHHAVTRGVDPDVRLKNTGVSEIGSVPETWSVAPFKRHVGFQEGPGIMAADFRDEGTPLLRISGMHGEEATLEGCNFLDPNSVSKRWAHFKIREGDYLLVSSASTGKICRAGKAAIGAIPYTGIIRLWPMSDQLHMPFLKLVIQSEVFQRQIDRLKSGVGIEHFGPTHLKRVVICLPSADEQQRIAIYVAAALHAFDDSIVRLTEQTKTLQEFRTRLISDVVTGRLDVRSAASSMPAVAAGFKDSDGEISEAIDVEDPASIGEAVAA